MGPGRQPEDARPARGVRQIRGAPRRRGVARVARVERAGAEVSAATGQALEAPAGRQPPLRFDGVTLPVAGLLKTRSGRGTRGLTAAAAAARRRSSTLGLRLGPGEEVSEGRIAPAASSDSRSGPRR